jgi:hypothetical protein
VQLGQLLDHVCWVCASARFFLHVAANSANVVAVFVKP